MPTKKKGKKVVKAWAVIRQSKLEMDTAMQYQFEIEEGIRKQVAYMIFKTERTANRWINKWHAGNEKMRSIPCTITYTL